MGNCSRSSVNAANLACTHDVELTRAEYTTVRRGALRFAVVAGHEDGVERVVDEIDRCTVVEKTA